MPAPVIDPLRTSSAVTPLLGLVIGIGLAYWGAELWTGLGFFILGAFIYLLLLGLKKRPTLAFRYNRYHFVWIILWGIGLGIVSGDLSRPYSIANDDFSKYSAAKGTITEITDRTSGEQLTINVFILTDPSGKIVNCRNLKVLVHTDASNLKPGDMVEFPLKLKRIADSPNSFRVGYAQAMERKGILYSQSLESKKIKVLDYSPGLIQGAKMYRDRIAGFIESSSLDKKTSYFLNSLLLGDRTYLLPETKEIFVNAGIAHVLALSGMHVGILAAIILFILFPINFTGLYRWRLLLTGSMLWVYALISGLSPSTVRACIMISIVFLSIFTQRKASAFNALCISAILILIIDPWALFDIGFQLSFICVASIILFVNRLNYVDQRSHGITYKIVAAIITTLITTFVAWILIAYYFQSFPINFIPANLIILPILPFFIIISIVFLFLQFCGLASPWMSRFVDGFYYIIEETTRLTGSSANSILEFSPSIYSVALWFTGIVILALCLYSKRTKRYLYFGVSLLAVSLIIIPFSPKEAERENLLICDTFHAVEIKMKKVYDEESFIFPTGKTSLGEFDGLSIVTLASVETEESLVNLKKELFKRRSIEKVNFVIVTGANRLPLSVIYNIFLPERIVIHPSVRKSKEQSILKEADSLYIPVHSLRLHHPLKLSTDKK